MGLCGQSWQDFLEGIINNPVLLAAIVGTEIIGGGPEDPLVDAAVVAEIEAAQGGEALVGGAQSALAGPLLSSQLANEAASSAFAADGTLTGEAITGSREIIPASQLGNPKIPSGFSKFSTKTFQSPSGDFKVHFYMNPQTGEPFYGLDYKSVLNSGGVGE